jgi:hypothetical protein
MEAKAPGIPRGSFADPSFQGMYEERAERLRADGVSRQEEFSRAYYRYLLTRRNRLVRLSCPGELGGIEAYLQYAARVLFEMMRGGERPPREVRHGAAVGISVGFEPMIGGGMQFELSHADRGVLGSETVLGDEAADLTPRIDVEWRISLAEWEMLTGNAEALACLADACELGVPVHFNYRISFAVDAADRAFCLGGSPAEGEKRSLLGVNTALGAE